MLALTTEHIVGMAITLLIIIGIGIYAGSKVKSAADFSIGGRRAGAGIVAGAIMGTLVGGASTIGTAQLAFKFGLCAWWFTLGAGVACLVLGLGLARSLYESGVETTPQYLVGVYGDTIGPVSSVFSSLGMFINIIAQILSAVALLTAIFHMDPLAAAVVGLVLALAYVFFGGVWGAGLVGIAKLVLLYLVTIVSGVLAYNMFGGTEGLTAKFPDPYPWFSFFGRGYSVDLAAGFSLLVGVLSTQSYIQAICSGRTLGASRTGALISAALVPPIGIGGILVGLFMRANFPDMPSGQVLPVFIMNYFPPLLAGVAFATLLIAIIGTWAGLTLGISTMLTKDIYQKIFRPRADDRNILFIQRLLVFLVSICGLAFVSGNMQSMILSWSFLSMGLRGCTILCPLLGAMFFPRLLTPAAGVLAAFLGPAANVAWFLAFPKGIDPLYPGLLVSLATLLIVSLFTRKKEPLPPSA